jgi:predicted ABC-type ATPase
MDLDSFQLSDEEISATYERIFQKYAEGRPSLSFPRLVIVGGQPGAGKSRISRLAAQELNKLGLPAMVDIDDTRQEHPKKEEIFEAAPFKMADVTNTVGWTWTSHLLLDARQAKNNLVYQATIRQTSDIQKLIKEFQADGFAVDLFAIAVNDKHSNYARTKRFEDGLRAYEETGEIPRWVPLSFHNAAYRAFPSSVEELASHARLDRVGVFRRSGEQLYFSEGRDVHRGAGKVVLDERNRLWSPEEKRLFAEDWRRLLKKIEDRDAGRLKPRWYLRQAQILALEAAYFADALQAAPGRRPNLRNEEIKLKSFSHVFARSDEFGLVCYDRVRRGGLRMEPTPSTRLKRDFGPA